MQIILKRNMNQQNDMTDRQFPTENNRISDSINGIIETLTHLDLTCMAMREPCDLKSHIIFIKNRDMIIISISNKSLEREAS